MKERHVQRKEQEGGRQGERRVGEEETQREEIRAGREREKETWGERGAERGRQIEGNTD